MTSILHRDHTVARPGFNRWLVPTAGTVRTSLCFFVLGTVLYILVPWTAQIGSKTLFVLFFGVILSMYGGGFATIPAYLKDVFGTMHVGAIHGRLLTAWSVAGVAGPVLVNYIRQYQLDHGVAKADAYTMTMTSWPARW